MSVKPKSVLKNNFKERGILYFRSCLIEVSVL